MRIDRRTFVSAALSVSVGGTVALALSCWRQDGRVARAQVELAGHFRDLGVVVEVGREVLSVLPAGDDAEALLELVAPERGTAALQREIRAQYGRGETVSLRGWPVALTEARIYALVALGQTSAG